ncbi:oxidoreductase [Corynebacterium sp. CNJ-954]|uniref:CE1759 family FMN reductase n=1 Tax=Corynebacterium sp. CNJ-954 TaxID=1904962 RepID=UPI0009615933|nr:CE1759 family FMN reductase [Corynebacterium sp. CNJ-954]OLT55505.1 oxidoreductase [Corynebacterium sp. CNJ-954]
MSTRKLVVINAGLSNPSSTRDIATRVAYAAEHEVAASGATLEVTVLDLRALAGDLATFMTTMIPTPDLEDARLLVGSADALIAATPVFQGSYAGLFKMFFDTLDKHALQGLPVSLVATAGTPRHSMVFDYAMRPLLSFLQATVLPTGVFVATGEYGESDAAEDLRVRITRAGSEIASALGAGRSVGADAAVEQTGVAQARGTGEFGGFEALLRAHSGS